MSSPTAATAIAATLAGLAALSLLALRLAARIGEALRNPSTPRTEPSTIVNDLAALPGVSLHLDAHCGTAGHDETRSGPHTGHDIVVAGPSGIFVIDLDPTAGNLSLDRRGVCIDGHPVTIRTSAAVRIHAAHLERQICLHLGRPVPVRAIHAVAATAVGAHPTVHDVTYSGAADLVDLVANTPDRIAHHDLEQTRMILGAHRPTRPAHALADLTDTHMIGWNGAVTTTPATTTASRRVNAELRRVN